MAVAWPGHAPARKKYDISVFNPHLWVIWRGLRLDGTPTLASATATAVPQLRGIVQANMTTPVVGVAYGVTNQQAQASIQPLRESDCNATTFYTGLNANAFNLTALTSA